VDVMKLKFEIFFSFYACNRLKSINDWDREFSATNTHVGRGGNRFR